MKNSGPG